MSLVILKKQDLHDFVNRLSQNYRVGGPVQKNGGFAFETIEDPAAFAATEAARLRIRYPKIPVAALLYDAAEQMLLQIEA